MEKQESRYPTPWRPETSDITMIYVPHGSTDGETDFDCSIDDSTNGWWYGLFAGDKKNYSSRAGRSSDSLAPFFHVRRKNEGFIAGIGWTGQWNCEILRELDGARFRSKIQDGEFFLYPNEKIRTSSVTFMQYSDLTFYQAQNKWRSFLREEISPVKSATQTPLCTGVWGGMPSSEAIRRVSVVDEAKIPVEYIWMDAGWCGEKSQPTLNEYEGDWYEHTGDWRISKFSHPNELVDLAEKIRETGRKYLLWFEPERVIKTVPAVKEYPSYFLSFPYETNNALLNLGNEDALSYCIETISDIISKLSLAVYRQDFNTDPLECWQASDEENRKGLTEIKYINGLYAFWDELKRRFPTLLIDNCASGGRRIDMETLKRSVPLWRSDLQCPANAKPEATQMHDINYALWMPYSGTSTGRVYDTYFARSSYTSALTSNYAFSASDPFGDDQSKLDFIKRTMEDYIKTRPYYDGDLYPLTKPNADETSWLIAQWHRKDGDGMLQIFKRAASLITEATLELNDIDENKNYLVSDIDGGETTVSGKTLKNGFPVRIKDKRVAKILFYKPL
jgi:alpha-galactosidase